MRNSKQLTLRVEKRGSNINVEKRQRHPFWPHLSHRHIICRRRRNRPRIADVQFGSYAAQRLAPPQNPHPAAFLPPWIAIVGLFCFVRFSLVWLGRRLPVVVVAWPPIDDQIREIPLGRKISPMVEIPPSDWCCCFVFLIFFLNIYFVF